MWVSMPELVEVIGKEWAKILCVYKGGIKFYVPKTAEAGHELAKIIGMEVYPIFCAKFGGEWLTLPNGRNEPHKQKIMVMLEQGQKTKREIALAVGVTENYVYKVASVMPRDRQISLPLTFMQKQNSKRR